MSRSAGPKLFFINSKETDTASLDEAQSQHVLRSLRLEEGAELKVALRTTGERFRSIISSTANGIVRLRLLEGLEVRESASRVAILLCSLCKSAASDLICEKATELGVETIAFVQTSRSVTRIKNDADKKKKLDRFERKALAASGQCGRATPPQIKVYQSLKALGDDMLHEPSEFNSLLCSLEKNARSFEELEDERRVVLAIGPEGDFSPEEYELLSEKGFRHLSLGPYTLRAETAAIAAVARCSLR